ncbi:uncharacterized protein MONOS_8427 [Monocercomonoides exilis]|uniref:uncharacterized protein n=1 Tax=Monocercomonoides exilis TaxID=2049356 RepID=UPI003559949C|nr:hypothetical protein MONOS_8427 [Monocercomonoides exilis]|eukprot:MONOS_8427.1-p1 / transcript=MONOS_8427.1 / gene=MONOS_8427 / organism=Monocercomonoides_exilis_PA203 / gene_product=unspecified product / transcript_product=unspecified product / location=Mono_scaffold00317:23586-24050(-) / protein_length=155 / sequence_SO=supercontig / SO=protein_coding / is_pseudo=false
MVLFEDELHLKLIIEKDDFLTISIWMCRKCINTVFEAEPESNIKMFFEKFEGLQSEKGEAETSVFLGFLLNYHRTEAVKRKEAMKKLYGVICSCDILTSSSGTAFREITFSELDSLLYVCNLQTPQALSLRIFRDAYRLSGCCPRSFASVLEAF